METQASTDQPAPKNGPQPFQKRLNKRKQLQHSAEIVYSKGASIQTLPSLSNVLKGVTESIVGLQYVWEYRSPTKSVPPHYQCKLCAVSRLQQDMLAHVKSWKHSFRYMKKAHPDKVPQEEEEILKDPVLRKVIRTATAQVEALEGRGQIHVILREPCEVLAFKGLSTAVPKPMPPPVQGMGHFGPRYSEPRFLGEYPHQGGPFDCSGGDYAEPGFGSYGYSCEQGPLGPGMDRKPFPEGPSHHSAGPGGFGSSGDRAGYGPGGRLQDNPGRMQRNEYQSSLMDRPVEEPQERPSLLGVAPDSGNLSNTLLKYLDSFRIENENDAQLVLKVTQKLTDVLMDYRLRSVSAGPSLNSFSMSSTSFSSTNSRPQNNRFTSPSRYSAGPARFFK